MKKIYTTLFAVIAAIQFSNAQWLSSGSNMYYNAGNVSIGTTNFLQKFTIKSPGTLTGSSSTDYDFGITDGAFSPLQLVGLVNTSGTYGLLQVIKGGVGPGNLVLQSIGGNVGIGTTSPSSSLDIFHYGTGTTLRIGGSAVGTSNDASIDLYANNSNLVPAYARIALGVNNGGAGVQTGYLNFSTINSGALTEKMRITANGNVLIGKTAQANVNYMLDINGNVRANTIVVNSTGADFVFDPGYKLPKLSEVQAFIEKNHHLPEIASANDMRANGMEVSKLNTQLLQKVEELTLYLIEKDKQISQQKENAAQLNDRVANLEIALLKLTQNK